MSGRSHLFQGYQYFWEVDVSCSRTQHGDLSEDRTPTSLCSGVRRSTTRPPRLPTVHVLSRRNDSSMRYLLGFEHTCTHCYCPPIFTLDLPYMHEYITRSLHSIFNYRKDIVYRRSSTILISVIRISYRKISLYECPFNIQRRLGLGVAYMALLVKALGSSLGKLVYLRFFS